MGKLMFTKFVSTIKIITSKTRFSRIGIIRLRSFLNNMYIMYYGFSKI